MGLSSVVDNLRTLKKTVKKPIVAFRETMHNAYTKAYVGSPERVDEFYNYIKVYTPNKHNDLCMMSITADINRFSMIPDKNTFFHVLKLERHFDRMIAARKQPDVNGDMAIQILSGHNNTFMSKYRRYKTRSAAKELKRSNQRFKALNVRRHTQLPGSGSFDSEIYRDATPEAESDAQNKIDEETTLEEISKEFNNVKVEIPEISEIHREVELEKKDISLTCEMTKPVTVVAAPEVVPECVVEKTVITEDVQIQKPKVIVAQKKVHLKSLPERSMMSVVKKHDPKFKVAKSVTVKKRTVEATTDLENVMEQMKLEEHKKISSPPKPKIVVEVSDDESDDQFDNCDDDDSSDGSDIEELEKIEDNDVDALEYEMI